MRVFDEPVFPFPFHVFCLSTGHVTYCASTNLLACFALNFGYPSVKGMYVVFPFNFLKILCNLDS